MSIRIDTGAVASVASQIDSINNRMRNDFDALEKGASNGDCGSND